MGWSGCEGEVPCDDVDACCRDNDRCVQKKGYICLLPCLPCCALVLVSEMAGWMKPCQCSEVGNKSDLVYR